tara:strand:- start:5281 stop:5679 length:399 start_codon:yes stop_codon:yes gene_type:complete
MCQSPGFTPSGTMGFMVLQPEIKEIVAEKGWVKMLASKQGQRVDHQASESCCAKRAVNPWQFDSDATFAEKQKEIPINKHQCLGLSNKSMKRTMRTTRERNWCYAHRIFWSQKVSLSQRYVLVKFGELSETN